MTRRQDRSRNGAADKHLDIRDTSVDRTTALETATLALAASNSFEDVVRAMRGAAAILGASGALMYRVGKAGLGEDPQALYGVLLEDGGGFGIDVARAWQVVSIDTEAAVAEVVRTGVPIFHANPEQRAAKYPHLMSQSMSTQFASWATCPMLVEGTPVGSLTLAWTSPQPGDAFTKADRAFVEALAAQCAVSLERVRLYAAERAAHLQAEASAEALRRAETRLGFAMEVAALGAWELDLSDQSAWRSLRHDQIFGYPEGRESWTYQDFLAHVHPDDRTLVDDRFGGALANQTPWDFVCRIARASDGAERWIAARGEVMTDHRGQPERVVGVVRDITDQHHVEQAVREARDAAEAASRAKSDFMAVMSHELRTPLNAIGGYAELIELGVHGPVTAEQRTALDRIQRNQRALLSLINEVLNYARLEARTVVYDLVAVPVHEAISGAEAFVAPQLRAKGLTYSCSSGDPKLSVRADPDKVQQVLLNLLSNAIKFTGARNGQIGHIDVSWGLEDDEGQRVAIRVRDSGMGIAADKLEAVFEPFPQVDQRLTRSHSGTGLGLAISRELARGMNGDLTVESTAGVGSTFIFTLPRA